MNNFALDVEIGLTAREKSIPSKYFYDEEGSRIFQQIMHLPEYYLTRTEFALLEAKKEEIRDLLIADVEGFDLIELGAGDGLKTRILLNHFLNKKSDFRYLPIDISEDALDGLVNNLKSELPDLKVEGMQGDYFEALSKVSSPSGQRKVVLFLGSNIGNFRRKDAVHFFTTLCEELDSGDLVLVGADLKKDPRKILAAYDDAAGVTRDFNLNLLRRMNRELGADFDLEKWSHYANYDPFNGQVRSYLISNTDQTVFFEELKRSFHFPSAEAIHTEISRKYTLQELAGIANEAGFSIVKHVQDDQKWFVDSVWRKI